MSERINKTSICSVVFLDIIDYSKMPVSEQSDLKDHFNALINEAIKDVAQNDRIILDTGDGAAISLLGAPEEALFVSMTIRDGILNHNNTLPDQPLFVRIGINLGPVRVVSDINGQPNIIGDGINVAQRVMSFAEPNQILVSRSYYEVTSRLTKEITGMFTYSGIKHDKHVREHEVYVIRPRIDSAVPEVTESVLPAAASAPAVKAGRSPLGRTGWIILGVLVAGLLSAAVYWSSKTRVPEPQLADPMLNIPTSPVLPIAEPAPAEIKAITAAGQAETVPAAVLAQPDVAPAEAKKPEEIKKKPAKRKKASVNNSQEDARSMDSGTAHSGTSNAGGASNRETHSVTHKPEPSKPTESTKDKSGWDNFTNSVKQGGKKECSQGEIAMGQCH